MSSSQASSSPAGQGAARAQARYGWPTLMLSSVFGLGYLPKAPGTFGTLAALPLWYVFAGLPWSFGLIGTFLITLFAITVSSRAELIYGSHDVGHIVIDEVAGMLWCTLGIPFMPVTVVVAFVLFRLLDALKPGPIGWVDRELTGGAGVVLDDVAAGLAGLVLLWLMRLALGGWL